jgi:hypothetical protein
MALRWFMSLALNLCRFAITILTMPWQLPQWQCRVKPENSLKKQGTGAAAPAPSGSH